MGGGALHVISLIFFRFHKLIESLLKTYIKIRRWKDLKIVFVFRIFNELRFIMAEPTAFPLLRCIYAPVKTCLNVCISEDIY